MRHASLFTGIGGFDLAAQWIGWENIFQVENDKFCNKVLEKNFPTVTRYGDIKEFDGTKYTGLIDVLTGGFPCQPFSVAGKRKGEEDDRFLWPEMLRVIREIKPPVIVGENVTGIVSMALKQVLASLEDEDYNIETFVIPACALNAPHRRNRVWILCYTKSQQNFGLQQGGFQQNFNAAAFADPNNERFKGRQQEPIQRECGITRQSEGSNKAWRDGWSISSPRICGVDDGIPNRTHRLKSLGNAIVPQVAYEIFKAIEKTTWF